MVQDGVLTRMKKKNSGKGALRQKSKPADPPEEVIKGSSGPKCQGV